MLKLAAILVKVLVVPFYKVNTGFFLFLFLLLFGFMDASEIVLCHRSLMQTIAATGIGLGVAMAVAVLYNYKCVAFVVSCLERPENGFLVNLQGIPVREQLLLLLLCQFILYLPVLLYLGLTILVGLQYGLIGFSLVLLIFLLLSCAGSAGLYFLKLNSYHKPAAAFKLPVPQNYSKQPVLYAAYHLLHEKKLAWAAVKLFSGFIFYLVFVVNRADFSLPYFRLLFLICTLAHSMLVYASFEFAEKQLAFTRSLPISRSKRLLAYLITYLLLLLPELCWLVAYSGNLMTWRELLLTFAAGLGQLLLLTAVLYLPNLHTQRFALFACLIYLVSAVLLPSGIAVVLMVEIVLALYIFYSRYYTFEFNTAEN